MMRPPASAPHRCRVEATLPPCHSSDHHPCSPFLMLRQIFPPVADLWQKRELLWQFTQRNVELRHRGSHLGLIWSFLNPLLMLGLYVMVFGYIFGGKFGIVPNETPLDYALGIFLSLTLYHFIAEVIGLSPGLIVANPNFVKKVVFPLEILPASSVFAAVFHLLISLALVLAGIALFGPGLHAGLWWLPVIIAPLLLLALGVSWMVSALGVFFRDLGQITQFVSIALMWGSGVFFSAEKYPAAWAYLRYNPILLDIQLARDAALWGRPLNPTHLAYVYGCSFAACLIGHLAFRKMKPAFADVL